MTPFSWITVHVANLLIDVAYDGLEVYDSTPRSRFVAACVFSMSQNCAQKPIALAAFSMTESDLADAGIDTVNSIYLTFPYACALVRLSKDEAHELYLAELAIRNL